MTIHPFNLSTIHPTWLPCIETALQKMDPEYIAELASSQDWLPDADRIFSAFSLPVNQVNYVLVGESPYPRKESANGYAFWDASVNELWSATGLSKKVNRATSLRNIIKMLLIADGKLDPAHTGQEYIANINKDTLIKTNTELFTQLLHHGFLLLNATPVLQNGPPMKDARAWHPFTEYVVNYLQKNQPEAKFILLGRIANTIDQFLYGKKAMHLYAEHPYNVSFITNQEVINFFKPLHLLSNDLKNKKIGNNECNPLIATLP